MPDSAEWFIFTMKTQRHRDRADESTEIPYICVSLYSSGGEAISRTWYDWAEQWTIRQPRSFIYRIVWKVRQQKTR